MRDLHNSTKIVPAINPAARADNTLVTGADIDRAGFESVEFVIQTGALPDADGTFTVEVQESDAGGGAGYTAVADSDLIGTEAQASFTFAADNAIRKIGYKGSKRFVRVNVQPANVAAGAEVYGALAILGHARHAPAQTGDGAAVTQVP